MNKRISFSLFGDDPKYYIGAEKNTILNKKLLPDWETIIYYHPEKTKMDPIKHLSNLGAKVIDVSNIIVGGKNSIEFPFFWRFLDFLEDGYSISRDLDSRVSDREVEYINRWLNGNCNFSIIRDHPWHAPVPSGLFGIKNRIESFVIHFNNFISSSDLKWGSDQEILWEYIQNVPSEDICYCGFDKPNTYIPRDDKEFFIGIQLDENDQPTKPSGEACLKYLKEINL
jgi:hypothetical protein